MKELFDNISQVNFSTFAGAYASVRLFFSFTNGSYNMHLEEFKEVLESDLLPKRVVDYVNHVYVPTQDEIEEAS